MTRSATSEDAQAGDGIATTSAPSQRPMVARVPAMSDPDEDAATPDDDGSVAEMPFSDSDVADGAALETDFATPADFETAEFDPSAERQRAK